MGTAAPGIQIAISGEIAETGANFSMKVYNMRHAALNHLFETSGEGDGGESTFIPGRNTRRFGASGVLETDSGSAPGFGNMGSAAATLTQTFATGRTIAGSALIAQLSIIGGYRRGGYVTTASGVYSGSITESGWS